MSRKKRNKSLFLRVEQVDFGNEIVELVFSSLELFEIIAQTFLFCSLRSLLH